MKELCFLKSSLKAQIRGVLSVLFSSNVTSQWICFHTLFSFGFILYTPGLIQSSFQSVERFLLISGELVLIQKKRHQRVPPISPGGHQAAGTGVLRHHPARLTHAELCFLLFSEFSSEEVSLLQFLSLKQCFCLSALWYFICLKLHQVKKPHQTTKQNKIGKKKSQQNPNKQNKRYCSLCTDKTAL